MKLSTMMLMTKLSFFLSINLTLSVFFTNFQNAVVGTPSQSSFAELQMDQPLSSSSQSSASSTVIVISGQRTKLLCPLIDQTKLLTNKKLLPSSAANSVVVHQDGSSSTTAKIPIKWQKGMCFNVMCVNENSRKCKTKQKNF